MARKVEDGVGRSGVVVRSDVSSCAWRLGLGGIEVERRVVC